MTDVTKSNERSRIRRACENDPNDWKYALLFYGVLFALFIIAVIIVGTMVRVLS